MPEAPLATEPMLRVRDLEVSSKTEARTILRGVSVDIPKGRVTGIIGPSGAGKSTLLRCLNRLIDLTPSLRVRGEILFDGRDIRSHAIDPDDLRRRIGIVFQQPVTFPGSVERNVLFAARRLGLVSKRQEGPALAMALEMAGLLHEVKDRLKAPAAALSVGQQQRLAIARVLAGQPDVLLMDEPTSALDPRSTALIEETIAGLKGQKTVVLVTHQLEQARRIADWVACICPKEGAGELVEADRCDRIFYAPSRSETREYLGLPALHEGGDRVRVN